MKKFLVVALLLVGCSSVGDRLVSVSDKAVRTTTSIEVTTSDFRYDVEMSSSSINITKVPVQFRGAGVFITSNGHVLTCSHLFWSNKVKDIVVIDYYGNTWKAELLARDDRRDLALLKINPMGKVAFSRLADPRKLKVGQEVIAIGNPLGLEFSVTHGIISALNRDIHETYNLTQSDTFINPGNSGGPLFNMKGEIIGINVLTLPPVNAPVFTGLGFSVQTGQIVEFLAKYRGIDKAIPKFDMNYWLQFILKEVK